MNLLKVLQHSLLVLMVGFLCACGEEVNVLNNGEMISGLSGNVDTELEYEITLPNNTQALRAVISGSEQVQLVLLDANGVDLGACDTGTVCTLSNPAQGTYKLKVVALDAYSNVSLVAAWSGTNVSSIANGVTKTGLAGNADHALLQSISMGVNDRLLIEASSQSGEIELFNGNGVMVDSCSATPCVTTHFTQFLQPVLNQAVSDYNLTAVWAGPSSSTLKVDSPLVGLSGTQGAVLYHSFYIPLALGDVSLNITNPANVTVQVLDESGETVANCVNQSVCEVGSGVSGVFFVKLIGSGDFADVGLSLDWDGIGENALVNGSSKTYSLLQGENIQEMIVIPEEETYVMVSSSVGVSAEIQILDAFGEVVTNCYVGEPCHFKHTGNHSNGLSSVYFISVTPDEDIVNFNLSVAWAGPSGGTLENGTSLSGLPGNQGNVILQSISVPEDYASVMIWTTWDFSAEIKILDTEGKVVSTCYSGDPCLFGSYSNYSTSGEPAVYLISVVPTRNNQGDFSLSVAWVGNNGGSMENGDSITGLSGTPYDVILQSISIPEDEAQVTISGSGGFSREFRVFTASGQEIASCLDSETCEFVSSSDYSTTNEPAKYFIATMLFANVENFDFTVNWSGAN